MEGEGFITFLLSYYISVPIEYRAWMDSIFFICIICLTHLISIRLNLWGVNSMSFSSYARAQRGGDPPPIANMGRLISRLQAMKKLALGSFQKPRIWDRLMRLKLLMGRSEVSRIEFQKTDEPEVEPLKINEPEVEPLKIDEPEVEPLKTDEPEVEPLKTDEPEVEPLKINEPEVEPLKTDEPDVESSDNANPDEIIGFLEDDFFEGASYELIYSIKKAFRSIHVLESARDKVNAFLGEFSGIGLELGDFRFVKELHFPGKDDLLSTIVFSKSQKIQRDYLKRGIICLTCDLWALDILGLKDDR